MSQHSVASLEQLLDLDVSKGTLRRARQHGVLSTIIPGIVRLTGSPETFASRAMALQLHTGDDSFVSGFSAGVLHGLREMPRRIVEVTVPEMQRYVMPTWGRLHRSSWIDLERDIASRGSLRLRLAATDAVPAGGRVQPVPLPTSRRGLLAPPAGHARRRCDVPRRDPPAGPDRRKVLRALAGADVTADSPEPERPRARRPRGGHAGRPPRARASVPARAAHRRGDPPRPRLAQRPARRRAGPHVVARRRHRAWSATRPGEELAARSAG